MGLLRGIMLVNALALLSLFAQADGLSGGRRPAGTGTEADADADADAGGTSASPVMALSPLYENLRLVR